MIRAASHRRASGSGLSVPAHKKTWRWWLPVIIAFLVPIVVMTVIYIGRSIFPFGEEMYLRSDMYHQYAPFLKLFQRILQNGGSLSYSWEIGLGSNFISTYAYYLASPLNWIVGLFPSDIIPELMSSFIIFKMGLMSAAMTYYLQRKFHRCNYMAAAFGIFYGMSAYLAAYSWNLMWLDCLVLLPLMMLGLEQLVRKKKCLLYTICFAIAVLSNYYIAIMLCIYSVLYVIYLLIAEAGLRGVKAYLKIIGRYVLYTFIGGCMGAICYLPALLNLMSTASADSAFPTELRPYFNLLEMIAHGVINTEVTMLEGYLPNIYCTMLVFALVPLYWLNKRVSLRKKIGKTVLLAILLLSFAFNIPAYIWHGFHFPNSLPSRQSFLYIFLLLTVAYEAMIKIKEESYKEIIICFGAAIAAVFALQALYNNTEDYPMSIAYVGAAFLVAYGLVLVWRKASMEQKKRAGVIAATVVFLAISVAEVAINTDETGYGTTNRTNYVEDNQAIDAVLSEIEEDGFYRVEKFTRRTKNDGAWSGYRSASIFSSATTAALSDFYKAFGMQNGTNSFSYYGNTPFTSALLGVQYKLSQTERDDPLLTLVASEKVVPMEDRKETGTTRPESAVSYEDGTAEFEPEDYVYLYQTTYALPLGFMVNKTTQAEVDITNRDPFAVQNDFLDAAAHAEPIFEIDLNKSGKDILYTVPKSGRQFFYVQDKLKNLTITKENGEDEGSSNTFTNLECAMIVDAGYVEAGDILKLSTPDENKDSFTIIPALLDEDALDAAICTLGSEPFEVEVFEDTYIKGRVSASKDGMLFTTIPYDKGWSITVDGQKVETDDFYDAFIQIPISQGDHVVELRYQVPGLLAGGIISGVALIGLVAAEVLRRKVFPKQKKTDKNL